ncbi:uncharacterized protein [Parasteatoda tepidariorum]|uniref:uncharacterized protein n=1 Tax=Parasteatoda tepidariorum TaxID=114398 RepID=UPI001C723CD8|nr:uncharacterized protein LOC107448231 [Parasteatoda tepidariorum]
MTLKTILKNFLNYADTLDAQKKLGKDLYEVDFQKLKGLTEELKHDKNYATSEGLKDVNRRKNRYKDILPYDYTRVILSEYPGVPGSDYINANYIKGASGSLAYIASQGPLPNTVVDFWRMIWECEVQVIVMACNEQESGKYKCECYWPTDDEKKQYGNINVEFVKWRQVCPDFLVRTLKACWETEERVICQFHYTTWPDHGVPTSVQPILELVRLIRDCQAFEAVPVLIHCSAGCGRTGTICAIDFVWGLMRMGKLSKSFNLFNVIADMRRQRIAMVQTKEQYVLVHKAVSSLFEQQLRVIDNHTYENLDEDGEPLILKELQMEDDIYEDILEPFTGDICTSESKYEDKLNKITKVYQDIQVCNDSTQSSLKNDSFSNPYSYLSEISNSSQFKEIKELSLKSNLLPLENNKMVETNEDDDKEFSYSKHSRTLQRLCREESVKKLISGWNKAVEKGDTVKAICKDSHAELSISKSPISKQFSESFISELKTNQTTSLPLKDNACSQKLDNVPTSVLSQNHSLVDEPTSSDSSPKTNSSEDMHAGKLVGKATVIRRPSIAKLKALFEKSSQPSSETDNSRQRRPLFRSHSHYVSNSSRAFTLSDSSMDQHINMSNAGHELIYGRINDSACRDNIPQTFEYLNNNSNQSEHFSTDLNKESSYTAKDNRQLRSSSRPLSYYNSSDSMIPHTTDSSKEFVVPESFINSSEIKMISYKEHDNIGLKKERPPDLPTKKKQSNTSSSNAGDKKSSENLVPRFQISVSKGNSEVKCNKFASDMSDTNKTNKESTLKEHVNSNCAQDWNHENIKEYRKHSQEIERKILHKNQSFSDPEHCSGRPGEISKQAVKQKLSYTEQTYPKLSYSHGKTASDNRLPQAYETTYMNVNPLAQKNIRQIEDSLKNHPRGAIIDLTSRKSYIDEMNVNTDKQFVFRNSSQLVKVLQPQESRDLTSHEKCTPNKPENSSSVTTKGNATSIQKPVESKTDNAQKNNDLINSKNLLLHSPPPKSKRGHLSKTTAKSPLSPTETSGSGTPSSNKSTNLEDSASQLDKQVTAKASQATTFPTPSSQSSTISSGSSVPVADRSDPRYFPVTRQTASEAKALNRDAYSSPYSSNSIYETLYSVKQPNYQKSTIYEKHKLENFENTTFPVQDTSKNSNDNESHYGLQRSTSGPQMLPSGSDSGPNMLLPEVSPSQIGYSQTSEDSKKPSSVQNNEIRQPPPYGHSYVHANTIGPKNYFPIGPPKPPRTFHYDTKNSQERVPSSEAYKSEQNVKRDGGRYIVTVASPKHSSQNVVSPRTKTNQDYRYITDVRAPESVANSQPPPPGYSSPPATNEVHMSRSYPLTHYDNVYSHPRPYGKQFYPESMTFRNVQPVTQINNSLYGTVKEKHSQIHQGLYGTVKHKSDYENIYDSKVNFGHDKSNLAARNEHQSNYPNSLAALQYSQSDANVYSVVQPPKHPTHLVQNSFSAVKSDYQNLDDNMGSSSKRVYFDTLQRRHKQHVSWEQRRSHDDMDIRPAPSARLKEQIHARRSMVELDNLEISVVSDDGYPEKSGIESSIPNVHCKSSRAGEKSFIETTSSDSSKDSLHKKGSTHNKEASFGETLSKAFGRLTSFTKFSGKDVQSCSSSSNNSTNSGSKVSKQKEAEKHQDFALQSPNPEEIPSEQWTQV